MRSQGSEALRLSSTGQPLELTEIGFLPTKKPLEVAKPPKPRIERVSDDTPLLVKNPGHR
eukprot:7719590-Lingulodinium_polyedra.AAC.1